MLMGLLRRLKEDAACRQCRLRARNSFIYPCMHFLFCDVCLRDQRACPHCRTPASAVTTLFLA